MGVPLIGHPVTGFINGVSLMGVLNGGLLNRALINGVSLTGLLKRGLVNRAVIIGVLLMGSLSGSPLTGAQ